MCWVLLVPRMVGQLDGGKVSTELAAWWGTDVTLSSKPRVKGSWYLLLFFSVCNMWYFPWWEPVGSKKQPVGGPHSPLPIGICQQESHAAFLPSSVLASGSLPSSHSWLSQSMPLSGFISSLHILISPWVQCIPICLAQAEPWLSLSKCCCPAALCPLPHVPLTLGFQEAGVLALITDPC